jgi:hypothetical protein
VKDYGDRIDPKLLENVLIVGDPNEPATKTEQRRLKQLMLEVTKQIRDERSISKRQAKQALFVQA